MATTFEVISLGTGPEIDTVEGNTTVENAAALVGLTFGSVGSPLFNNVETLAPVGSPGPQYNGDNNANADQFDVGGTTYTYDARTSYDATVTFSDGTTATISIEVVQTTTGELLLFPGVAGEETEQALLESKPIQSVTLDSSNGSDSELFVDCLAAHYKDGTVDGTSGDDSFLLGDADADGDAITSGADSIMAGDGNDTVEGSGGSDTIDGGIGDDELYGDHTNSPPYGTLNATNSDNLDDSGGTETNETRAVELVTLANGDLIMITSERKASDDGIATWRIDNDPSSSTYGQIIGGQIDTETNGGNGPGFDNIEDMAAITLSNGNTYVYTADHDDKAIGITQINADGTLTLQSVLSNSDFDEISALDAIEVGGQQFLMALSGGGADNVRVYQVNNDGTLTQTDIVSDGSGAGENFLENNGATTATLLQSFTNSSGESFVMMGGTDDGISLWTLDGSGQLTLQNARADDQAGSGDTDPEGNDLSRDLVSPTQTGLSNIDAGTFAEIDVQTYFFVGGEEHDVGIFRIDPDTVNGDGTFDLTMVGHFDNVANWIASMQVLQTDNGAVLAIGAEESGIDFYDVMVNGDGTVSISLTQTISDGGSAELADVEDIDIEGGILVTASDNDDGVAIIETGLSDPGIAGNDSIDGGAGNDTIDGGDGDDTITGGDGDDVFVISTGHDTITDFNTGNTGTLTDGDSTNNDQIDLSTYYDSLSELWADQDDDGVLNQSNATDLLGNAVDYSDNTQFGAGDSLTFTGGDGSAGFFNAENTGVVCFVRGTPILTDRGEVPVEELTVGTLVKTVDNEYRPIRWIGGQVADGMGKNAPIEFDEGVLGNHSRFSVPPQHRILLHSQIANRMIGSSEALVSAKSLLSLPNVRRLKLKRVEYYHFLLDAHELVYSAGAITESLHTGPEALKSVQQYALNEILELFPELANGGVGSDLARPCLSGRLVKKLVMRHKKNQHGLCRKVGHRWTDLTV